MSHADPTEQYEPRRAQPQDRKPSGKDILNSAVRMQGANMAQKGTLDLIGGKLIMIVGVLHQRDRSDRNSVDVNRESIERVAEITRMTRSEVAERRAGGVLSYPDVGIQAVINKAAEDIAAILLGKADVE